MSYCFLIFSALFERSVFLFGKESDRSVGRQAGHCKPQGDIFYPTMFDRCDCRSLYRFRQQEQFCCLFLWVTVPFTLRLRIVIIFEKAARQHLIYSIRLSRHTEKSAHFLFRGRTAGIMGRAQYVNTAELFAKEDSCIAANNAAQHQQRRARCFFVDRAHMKLL